MNGSFSIVPRAAMRALGSRRFHEGRDTGKSTTPGGHYQKECLEVVTGGIVTNLSLAIGPR